MEPDKVTDQILALSGLFLTNLGHDGSPKEHKVKGAELAVHGIAHGGRSVRRSC